MGIILDLVLLAILILSIFMGYKKGLISVVFSLLALLIAIILTWILYTPITNLVINNTNFDESIRDAIVQNGVVEEDNNDENTENKYIEKYVLQTVSNTKNEVVKNTAQVIAEKTVAIIVLVGLFILIRLLLIVLKFVAKGIANLPIIKQFDKLGGTIYGIIRGVFIIYAALAICFLIMSINDIEPISETIDSSIVTKELYSNNFILNIIFK